MKRIAILVVLSVFFISSYTPKEEPDKYLVLIVLDACRADFMDLQPMPVIESLKKQGVTYRQAWVGHMINNTPTSHAVIQSGLLPAKNGIIGFFWKEPGSKEWIVPSTWDRVLEGAQIDIMKRHGAIGFVGYLKKKYNDILAASISGHKFYAAEAMGGPECDLIAFPSWGIERRLTEEQKQYGDLKDLTEGNDQKARIMYVRGKAPSEEVLNDLQLADLNISTGDDETAIKITLSIIKHQHPRILMLNLPHLDHMGHFDAGGYMYWRSEIGDYMAYLDRLIGEIVKEYKKLGIYERTVFIITGDHGMATNGKNLLPSVIGGKLGNPDVSSYTPDLQPFIWALTDDMNLLEWRATKLARMNLKYLRAIYFKHKEGDRYFYLPHHEYMDKLDPELDRAYRYLLDTHACSGSPDIYVIPYEHVQMRPLTYPEDVNGLHNAPTWKVQHVPLIIAGPGIKKGAISDYPARLVDLAPTVLYLFGMKKNDMDGDVLADALIDPENSVINNQRAKERIYGPMVKALSMISRKDLLEIYKNKYKDPESIP